LAGVFSLHDARRTIMDQKLDEELCRIAPHLFGDRYASMQTTCMCWGFEVGDGWFELLKEAALKLEPLIVAYIKDHPEERNPFPWFLMDSWYGIKWSSWHPHLALCRFREWLQVALGLEDARPWWPRASQIKEKYGTLRFYMTSGTNEMYAITDKAERQSSVTCEFCGKPGKLRGYGWYSTRCSPCWKREQHDS
jgi:hypothetical protein